MFINKNKSSLISKIRKYVYKNNNIYILNQQDKYLIISIYVSIFMVLHFKYFDNEKINELKQQKIEKIEKANLENNNIIKKSQDIFEKLSYI